MNTERMNENVQTRKYPGIKLLAAKEAVRSQPHDFEVAEQTEITLSPTREEYYPHFLQVELKSYKDLQYMGLVPRDINEDKIRQAITQDNEEARRLTLARPEPPHSKCSCQGEADLAVRSYGDELHAAYLDTRRSYQPALANLLAEQYNINLAWNNPLPAIVRKWAQSLQRSTTISMLVVLLKDVTIKKGATLQVDKNFKSFMARNIYIHTTGKLVHQGGYLKLWANSINRLDNRVSDEITPNFPWSIEL